MKWDRFARASRVTPAALVAVVLLASAGYAEDSGNFVVMLGQDTTAVEHYTRTASELVVDQVSRAPRVLQRHFTYGFSKGVLTKFTMVVTPAGSATPTQTIEANFGADSMRIRTQSGSAPAANAAMVLPSGTLVVPNSSPWGQYENQIMKLVQSKQDSLRTPLWFVGSSSTNWISVSRLGRDSVALVTDRRDVFHVRVDKAGHILGVLPIAGTGKYGVERVASLDLNAMTAAFAAREQSGTGLGTLSPRDTVRVASAGGAALMIDYGRPAKRGRVVFGDVVPYGEVWRTGANVATQFKSDKTLDFGGTLVPAGFYTVWTLPTANGWKLIINSETGQWGTAHKAEKDLYTIEMKVSALPQPVERFTIGVDATEKGGTLNLDWDTTRASAAFTTQP